MGLLSLAPAYSEYDAGKEVARMPQEFVLAATCEQTVSILIEGLAPYGYQLKCSFDLRNALQHRPDYQCPEHGATSCNCQYMVLLVYEKTVVAFPAVITAHGCNGLTRIRVPDRFMATAAESLQVALSEVLNTVLIDD